MIKHASTHDWMLLMQLYALHAGFSCKRQLPGFQGLEYPFVYNWIRLIRISSCPEEANSDSGQMCNN